MTVAVDPAGTELRPAGFTAGTGLAELCVDDDGIVLAERYTAGGRVVRSAEVVEVAVGDAVDTSDGVFDVGGRAPLPDAADGADAAAGRVTRLAGDEAVPGLRWVLPDPPDGFLPSGRWSTVSPQETPQPDPSADRRLSVSDVWTRGADVLVVEQGAASGRGATLQQARHGRTVDVGPLGKGQVVYDLRRCEVRVVSEDGFVRVFGTLPPGDLLAVARRLRPAAP